MFNSIGTKIKTLAKVICWIGMIGSVISGIVIASTTGKVVFFILVAGVGSLVSWLGSFTAYGFGQLIDTTEGIYTKLGNLSKDSSEKSRVEQLLSLRKKELITDEEFEEKISQIGKDK